MLAFIGDIFAALFQGLLGMFGMSDAQKLGRQEIELEDNMETIKELRDVNKINTDISASGPADIRKRLHDEYGA